jgi:hypothetical protein
MSQQITPFESIRRTNPAGNEFWSSRDFAKVLDYADYRKRHGRHSRNPSHERTPKHRNTKLYSDHCSLITSSTLFLSISSISAFQNFSFYPTALR